MGRDAANRARITTCLLLIIIAGVSFALTRIDSDTWLVLVALAQALLIAYVTRRAWIEYFWYRGDGPQSDSAARDATRMVVLFAVAPLTLGGYGHWLLLVLPAFSWKFAGVLCVSRPEPAAPEPADA